MEIIFIALQVFILVFLLLQDWVPLGRLNDIAGVRSQNTPGQLALATLINSSAIAITLFLSVRFYQVPYPAWVKVALVAILGTLFVGELRALVDTVFFWHRSQATGSLCCNVWQDARFSSRASRN